MPPDENTITRNDKTGKILILEYLLENSDRDVMRNTLTRMNERFGDATGDESEKKLSRSTIHKYLKQMSDERILERTEDEISSVNNQPMKIVRYKISERYIDNVVKLVSEYRNGGLDLIL